MRLFALAAAALLMSAALPSAQNAQAPPQPPPADTTAAALPVKRVVLYKTGVGYFEHLGTVRNRQDVTIRFTSAQLNDVLMSLTTIDLGKGQISGISYNSVAPLEQRLGALRLPLGEETTVSQLLGALRGARVEITSGGAVSEGRLLSVERRSVTKGNETATVDVISTVSDGGELRNVELTPSVRIRVVERDTRQEIGRYLDVVGSAREQDVRSMVISTTGSGERQLFVSYISEVPIWKSTYRLVFPSNGRPLLQGWAIVDNTIGEDWRNVELSLVAGAPQSFIQPISQPYYGQRPVVPMPRTMLSAPQTHEATLETASGKVSSGLPAAPAPPPPPPPAMARASGAGGRGGGIVGGVVGGMPESPERVFDQISEIPAMATGAAMGDLFEYRIKEPVTLRKNQSALVPIVNAEVGAEKVSLWNRAAGSGHPLRALWLSNSTTFTLDGGSMMVISDNAFAGEGLIEPIKPGERRLVSYGSDLGVMMEARSDSSPRRVARVRASDGIIIQETEERLAWTYKARNADATPATVIVEHRRRQGWTLSEGQTPVETAPDAYRFRVVIAPKQEAELVVREVRTGQTRIAVSDATDALIVQLGESGVPAAALQQALKPLLDKKAELAGIERELQAAEGRRATIVSDQERLRENMKALRGSAEEKQLLQRYTRQLDEQENQLDKLRQEITEATTRRDRAREELSKLVGSVTFDVAGSR